MIQENKIKMSWHVTKNDEKTNNGIRNLKIVSHNPEEEKH